MPWNCTFFLCELTRAAILCGQKFDSSDSFVYFTLISICIRIVFVLKVPCVVPLHCFELYAFKEGLPLCVNCYVNIVVFNQN